MTGTKISDRALIVLLLLALVGAGCRDYRAEPPYGLEWVAIPAGGFVMGCAEGDTECEWDEQPRRALEISAFEMTRTEITQAQYSEVTGRDKGRVNDCPACPAVDVSWHDAERFCRRIKGRLPTEAQWEYAARAGTTTKYFCGDDPQCLDSFAWYRDNSDGTVHPTAGKQSNAWGLCDLYGNVWEWCSDWHALTYDAADKRVDPQGPASGTQRVVRGGSWFNSDRHMRPSDRDYAAPENAHDGLGFRCVRN